MAAIFSPFKRHSYFRLARWHEFGDAMTPEMIQQSSRSLQTDLDIGSSLKMMESLKQLLLWKCAALIFLVWTTLLSGCSTFGFKKSEPITVGQVIQMSKDDVPPETIVKKIQDSESVYRLTAAQLAELHDMGVADPVLNYMQQTYIEAERRQQSAEDWDRDGMWGPYGW